ncbi:tRNA threonylcarbamoyladenosine biosynthesis protein TsaB [compost metagenome]
MGEIYAARFVRDAAGELQLQGSEVVIAPEAFELPADASEWAGVGTGFGAVDGALAARFQSRLTSLDAQALPCASDVLKIAVPAMLRGEGIAPEQVQPAYLRDNVALTLIEQQALRDSKR